MATSLQQQLAAIAANSTHQLDLKVQKERHSKSLLFEPREAASQSFDTLFQICSEGFEELCMLDARFRQYARSIFSEQSRNEDRTQMTQQENDELNNILESFLGLVGGRLMLKPAMTAVEWLVRRFRVQDYNTECMLLTFLPYHTSYIFPTLLSILAERLPPNFRFLAPYVASLQNPPRHSIISAAISNPQFFSVFSNYVLKVARARHQSAILLGFWASITAQSVNGALDASRSGKDSLRQQREEDILTRVLPILSAALGVKGVPELYLGSCMIMTILATKASLSDRTLTAMMEAVTGAWTDQTFRDGLTCLAVMAEEKREIGQSATVTRALIKSEGFVTALTELVSTQRAEKLITDTVVGCLDEMQRKGDNALADTVSNLLGVSALPRSNVIAILEKLLAIDTKASHQAVNEILKKSMTRPEDLQMLRQAARNIDVDLDKRRFPSLVALSVKDVPAEAQAATSEPMNLDLEPAEEDVESVVKSLPAMPSGRTSFLAASSASLSRQYVNAFDECSASNAKLTSLLSRLSLKQSSVLQSPEYLTFLARVWTSSKQPASRASALGAATRSLVSKDGQNGTDMQALLPYIITGLADSSQRVRKAAASLCTSISKLYGPADVWISGNIYGQQSFDYQLTPEVSFKFISGAIHLEDCILDGEYITRSLRQVLSGETSKVAFKASALHSICSNFAAHIRYTPVLRVKLVLLQIIGQVGKALGEARVKILLPAIKEWCGMSAQNITEECDAAGIERQRLDEAVIGSISRRSNEEITLLQVLATGKVASRAEPVKLAFDRIKRLLPQMSAHHKTQSVDFLLGTAFQASDQADSIDKSSHAMEVLRTANLGADVLIHMLETLPKISDKQDQPPSAKKQRLSKGDITQLRQVDPQKLQDDIRRITSVLELVEASKPEKHPELIKGLFHLLAELHHYKIATGSELAYLQNILFGCLYSSVEGIRSTQNADLDGSTVRADLIVDSIRTTSSPQIYNSGLLLISSIASWKPDLVLHSVMPLFTFMSSTLLKQSDDYSAHVADQTIATVVPPLAASLRNNGKSVVVGAANLLLSFTAAYEHIPLHRRVALFERLVTILGVDDTLFAVIATLIGKYSEVDEQVLSFVADLANRFSSATMLGAARKVVDLLFDALKPKRNLSNLLLGLDENPDDVEDTVETLVLGLAQWLQNPTLKRRLASNLSDDEQTAATIRTEYALLLEHTMHLDRDLQNHNELNESCAALLSAVLGLMPTKDFIESSAQLMQTGSDLTRQQVFDSLESRVEQAKRGDRQAQQVFLEVVPNCCVFIQEQQPAATRQAAISCIDQICVKYGKANRSVVLEAAQQICGSAALGSEEDSLKIVSTLCLASMVEVLGEEIVSLLPAALPLVLAFSGSDARGSELPGAGFSLLSALLDYVPWILSSKYLDSALTLAAKVAPWQAELDADSARRFSSLAAKKIGPAELFASIERSWAECEDLDEKNELLLILHQAIRHHTKSTITRNSGTLFKVMLLAFGLRSVYSEELQDDGTAILDLISTIALDMTLKLNDNTFRPFFIRVIEWATTGTAGPEKTNRLLSLYDFSLKLFEQLKSIVTSYSSFILEASANILQTTSSATGIENELLQLVLRTLQSSFTHDQDDFWQTPSHFDAIATPLLGQLKQAKTHSAEEYAIPGITAFAAAASSQDHLKSLNTTIMSFMRHEDSAVRLAAVKCERSITERLNFDWLALLPEMLPYISELQEDDDENVERETLRWVQQIEDVTGESLEGMLA